MAEGILKLKGPGALAIPGAFNAASALLVEKAGFKAVYVSGAGLSNSNGLPDTGALSRGEVLRLSSFIFKAVGIPAIVDADTGFGGPDEAARTIAAFEEAGASAIQIEDQETPKRCGHLPGKTVVPTREFVKKLIRARKARSSPDFAIIARTDARSSEGLSEAARRAGAYLDAGADIIFPEALESKLEFIEFAGLVKAPLMANMTEFGVTPYIGLDEWGEMGYSFVIFPMTAFRAGMKAMETALSELKEKGTQKGMVERLQTREELYRLIGYEAK